MKTVLVRGPVLSQSGYGEHTRFVLRSLRLQEEHLNIHILPTTWGETGWITNDDDERRWIDERVRITANHLQQSLPYDISVQVTIPNEWEQLAPINIGVTAGIETNKVSPVWLEKSNMMTKVITISEHSRNGFVLPEYHGQNKETGAPIHLKCTVPVVVAGYPVKSPEVSEVPLELEYDFNYLAVAQWGPRKNMENLVKWFVEENHDQEVGLVLKTSLKNNSVVDRGYIEDVVNQSIPDVPDRKCKIYLLHGDMTEAEVHSLYSHPKIKTLVSLTHGEGFGLPLFEAAYSGLPVIAPGWSGQTDFLYAPAKTKSKKNKNKLKPFFANVDFTLGPVGEHAVWPGVIEKETMWCYPTEGSFKMRLRQVRKNYDKWLAKAEYLQEWVQEKFEWDKQHQHLSYAISEPDPALMITAEDLPRVSIITSIYNGDEYIRPFLEDITRQTIFEDKCELILINANSPGNEEEVIQEYLEKYPDNIIYKRLEEDPGVYGVWNMGVEMASGEYLTNANLDDRKATNSLERHARELYTSKDIDLVYGDSYVVHTANIQWENIKHDVKKYNFDQFSKEAMLRSNLPHNNPMWRRTLHDKHGLFETKYRSAGDWEFWLRCAFAGAQFKKINQVLGIYYFNPVGISTNKETEPSKKKEEFEIFKKYQRIFLEEKNK